MSNEENNKERKQKVEITVDNKASERLANVLEKQMEQKTNEPSLNDLIVQFQRDYPSMDWSQATSKDMLKTMFKSWVNDNASRNQASDQKTTPAGSPLVQRQYDSRPEDLWTKRYEGVTKEEARENMIRDLREKAPTSKEAESYLNSLWEIALKPEVKERQHGYAPKNDELETKTTPEGFKVSTNETDIQRILRRWREERLRKMGVKPEGEQ